MADRGGYHVRFAGFDFSARQQTRQAAYATLVCQVSVKLMTRVRIVFCPQVLAFMRLIDGSIIV